jgi:urease accessory protein
MAGYAVGFLLTTAALHLGGMALGLSVQRLAGEGRRWALASLSAVLGGAGVFLFTQL